MRSALKQLGKGFLSLVYPALCLHCKDGLHNTDHPLCPTCLELLDVINPADRCIYCFSTDPCPKKKICTRCSKESPTLNGIASVFDHIGPAATLIKKLKYSNQPYLAQGCGAFMSAQFLRLNWPMPDLVIPIPISFAHLIERGYNQSYLLAESFAKSLHCPFTEALKRKSGDYSQAGLNKYQRSQLTGNTIHLKKGQQLQDKTILLIDDVMTTGSTLRKSAEALMDECPKSIYGLTFCRAL